MVAKRIVAFLSVGRDGRVIAAAGSERPAIPEDAVEVAHAYAEAGADEVFLRCCGGKGDARARLAERVSQAISAPLALEVGAATLEQIREILAAGAARAVIQEAALEDPDFIAELAGAFGSPAVSVALEAKREDGHWRVRSGGELTEWDAVNWARVVEAQGGGELVVASTGVGVHGGPFDLELLHAVGSAVRIPVLAAGEALRVEDLFDALMIGDADGVLVGSLLHVGGVTIREIKEYLSEHGLSVRPS